MKGIALALLLVVPVVLAGCAENATAPTPTPATGEATSVDAPWWSIGESWTLRYTQGGKATRTTTLAVYANNTFGDPSHFWLGVTNRQEALNHVFFDDNMFLGRIHWHYLAPHESGRHSDMYNWPLTDGKEFLAHAFGYDWRVKAEAREGGFEITGASAEGAHIAYDYDLDTRWFSHLRVTDHNDALVVEAEVTSHQENGAKGTYYFLRGRDYLDSTGGAGGSSETFQVADEGATSIAFLLDDITTSLAASFEFVDPNGEVYHRETIRAGETRDKVVEVAKPPTPGEWRIRYLGDVRGTILVRGIIEYKATI